MRTEDLILSLGAQAAPVSRNAVERRVAAGIGGGAALTFAVLLSWLGFRPDLSTAIHGGTFWMKWAYTISIGVIAVAATVHLSRPEASRPRWLWLLAVPMVLLAATTIAELLTTPAAEWPSLWMGRSWHVCTMRVVTLSLPIFGGLMLAFRRLAPTRLRLTGAVAGLAAGGCGAALYCLHCPEASALFVLIWYSLGIAGAAAIGALLGPRLLRW